MLSKPQLSPIALMVNPYAQQAIDQNKCPTCGKPVKGLSSEFENDLSRKEYSISGMCQACQDSVFSGDDEE